MSESSDPGAATAAAAPKTLSAEQIATFQAAYLKALKEELTGMGYDVDEFNRIGELKAIKRAVEDGTVDSIFDKVWYSRAAMAAGSGSIVDVQKVQAYWKGKGITVKTLADLDKVTAYMIKKYGKNAKMGMM